MRVYTLIRPLYLARYQSAQVSNLLISLVFLLTVSGNSSMEILVVGCKRAKNRPIH